MPVQRIQGAQRFQPTSYAPIAAVLRRAFDAPRRAMRDTMSLPRQGVGADCETRCAILPPLSRSKACLTVCATFDRELGLPSRPACFAARAIADIALRKGAPSGNWPAVAGDTGS